MRRLPGAIFVQLALLVQDNLPFDNIFVNSHLFFGDMGYRLMFYWRGLFNLFADSAAHKAAETWADVSCF